ncbi:MAG: hypothetical protein WCG44_02955 [bacterium]
MSTIKEKTNQYLQMANAFKEGGGNGAGITLTASGNQYATINRNWKAQEEVMLPDVSAKMKAIAKTWNLESEPHKGLPGPTEASISTASAIAHLIGAKLLSTQVDFTNRFNGKPVHIPSAKDMGEQGIIDLTNKFNIENKITTKIDRPTPAKLRKQVTEIENQFNRLLGTEYKSLPSPQELTLGINQTTRKQVDTLYRQPSDRFTKLSPDEEALVEQLMLMVGQYSASEIYKKLYNAVFAQSADIVLADHRATLARIGPDFDMRYLALKNQKPTVTYIAPWLTTEVMFPQNQQDAIENTTWTLTPTQLAVQRVILNSTKEDRRNFNLLDISNPNNPAGTVISAGTSPYVDQLKKKGTRILQPLVDKLVGQDLGGILVLRQTQAASDPVIIAVPNPTEARAAINRIARLNQNAEELSKLIENTVMSSENQLKNPIRPNLIRQKLPPLALSHDLMSRSGGDLSYAHAKKEIEENISHIQQQLRQIALAKAMEIRASDPTRPFAEIKTKIDATWGRSEQNLLKNLINEEAKMSLIPPSNP